MDCRSSRDSHDHGSAKSFRTQPMSPIAISSSASSSSKLSLNQIVGLPVNFRKPQQLLGSSPTTRKPSQIHALQQPAFGFSADAMNTRKARPMTSASSPSLTASAGAPGATPLSANATLNALLASYDGSSDQQLRPDSAPETRIRKQPAVVALLSISSSNAFGFHESSPPSSSSPLPLMQRQSQRCSGCGAYAEVCMGCFSRFKLQDGAAYKKQIIRSVEVLFEKATARAFTKMSAVIVQWLFGIWKKETQHSRHRRVAALQKQKLHRRFACWHERIYKRRIVGAMLYAENQQQVTREKNKEIAQLHGEVLAIASDSSVQSQMHGDELAKLQQLCTAQQQSLAAKNQELLTLRKELQEAKDRVAILEKQVIDPKELERIKGESVDYKKVAFQLATAVFQNMETQVEQLATSEGRHNLSQMFTKEILQAIDKPECQAFYNPLVELESAPMSTVANPAINSSSASAGGTIGQQSDSSTGNGSNNASGTSSSFFTSRMLNFHSSLSDGKTFVVLTKILHQAMCKVRPKRPPGAVSSKLEATSVLRENGVDLTEIAVERYLEHIKREENPEKRLELMIGTIGQALWLPVGLLNTKHILASDAEFNFATLSYLFTTFSPYLDKSFCALCNDFKMQLSAAKAKWRELREDTANYCDLARIYRGYATRNGGVNDAISLGDFMELLTECRVLDATFTANEVNAIIRKVDPKQTNVSAHRALPPRDFLEALIRVARKKHTAEHHRITISEAFCLLTDNSILPFAFRADADQFRTQIEEPKIRRLMIKFADEMKDLYGKYAVEDPKKKRKRPRMTAFTFAQCLIGRGIQDVTFNGEKLLALLQKVVRTKRDHESSSNSNNASTNGGSSATMSGTAGGGSVSAAVLASISSLVIGNATEDDELTFDEFEEAMIAIACHKFPDPYISFESRVEKFFSFYVRGLRGDSAAATMKKG